MDYSKEVTERAKKFFDYDPEVARYFIEVGRLTGDALGQELIRKVLEPEKVEPDNECPKCGRKCVERFGAGSKWNCTGCNRFIENCSCEKLKVT